VAIAPKEVVDPLDNLQPGLLNTICQDLAVPRQVFAALRERRVIVASISRRFLVALAAKLECKVDRLIKSLEKSPRLGTVSHKSDVKPSEISKVSFETLLLDAEVESDRVRELTAGDN